MGPRRWLWPLGMRPAGQPSCGLCMSSNMQPTRGAPTWWPHRYCRCRPWPMFIWPSYAAVRACNALRLGADSSVCLLVVVREQTRMQAECDPLFRDQHGNSSSARPGGLRPWPLVADHERTQNAMGTSCLDGKTRGGTEWKFSVRVRVSEALGCNTSLCCDARPSESRTKCKKWARASSLARPQRRLCNER